ncbi:hypothetical protein BDD12DRAFT_807467 [Trichophaea hybrida]|nr:hypothetical protein BDD12DRAFT_807467 [Trichophaea hybrida]
MCKPNNKGPLSNKYVRNCDWILKWSIDNGPKDTVVGMEELMAEVKILHIAATDTIEDNLDMVAQKVLAIKVIVKAAQWEMAELRMLVATAEEAVYTVMIANT